MASDPPDFASTQENTNYARLCRLLVDVGCTALRDTFDSLHPSANLHVVLSSPLVFSTLQSLRKKRVLNPMQWGKLFPAVASNVSSANFDVTLLMVLLRNICDLNPPVSTGSWDKLPPDSDNSTAANIVRIKWYRNDVYGHATKASVDDATFNALWQKISSAVLALGPGYGAVISRLKTECMDPATEAHYEKLLSDWKKDDDILKEMHERNHAELEKIKEKQQKTNNELGEMKENQQKTNNTLAEVKEMIKQQQPHERSSKESLKDKQVSKPLEHLVNDASDYLDKICKRLDTPLGGLGNYEDVAKYYGYDVFTVQSRFKISPDGPSKAMISSIISKHPDATIESFANVVVKQTRREDVARLLREFDCK
ncbi:uncharacterized protein LOC114949576 isoform X2 [Acropora millepora]|nr:uncharacterized protein LOC114949576 isoform X2 [Acropora millepora]XP_044162711.1 uncharacterized protein LOC114949576 isoform X2 [Acropora millepora]